MFTITEERLQSYWRFLGHLVQFIDTLAWFQLGNGHVHSWFLHAPATCDTMYIHAVYPLSTYIPPPSQKCLSIVQRLGLYPPLGRLANSPSKLRMSWDKAPRTFLLWQPALAGNPCTGVSSSIPWRAPGQGMAEKFSCSSGQCRKQKYLQTID